VSVRRAECNCGELRVEVDGDPIRISVCHCLSCQRRTGSAFGVQARWPADKVRVEGEHREYGRVSDGGDGRTYSFCPGCGATVFYTTSDRPELIAVPVGALADRDFPPPTVSVWEERMHPWVGLPEGIEHLG
jgi:hypothetical protein